MRTSILALAAVVVTSATAASADPAPAAQPPAVLSGRVLSAVSGLPVAGATVFISTVGGLEQSVDTDDQGDYRAELHHTTGLYDLIFVFGANRSSRHFDLTAHTDIHLDAILDDSGEVIDIHDHLNRQKAPVPVQDTRLVPEYSDRAATGNYWAKAWLLLEVDSDGTVIRIKFLKRPGYDLDRIAVETAFGLTFTPALDRRGRAVRSQVVYPIEWPSYWFLVQREGVVTRMPSPEVIAHVKCIGSNPLNLDRVEQVQRDCSRPDLTKADSEAWIAKP
jgi:hypothetical protein